MKNGVAVQRAETKFEQLGLKMQKNFPLLFCYTMTFNLSKLALTIRCMKCKLWHLRVMTRTWTHFSMLTTSWCVNSKRFLFKKSSFLRLKFWIITINSTYESEVHLNLSKTFKSDHLFTRVKQNIFVRSKWEMRGKERSPISGPPLSWTVVFQFFFVECLRAMYKKFAFWLMEMDK